MNPADDLDESLPPSDEQDDDLFLPAGPDEPPRGRVLLIDDDAGTIETFSRMLRIRGYEVWAGLSAEEGLCLAEAHQPHAVIVDLRMPLTSGIQFLRAMRAIPGLSDTPVAVVTGEYLRPGDPREVEIYSLKAQLRFKPIWLNDLVTLARDLLGVPAGPES